MADKTISKETAWTEINIAPRGKSWLHGKLIDSVHGFKTRQAMENAARAAQAETPKHPDDAAVDALAALMKAKLAKQRDKGYGGWDTDCTRERLSELLRAHVEKGDPVDVANFCAFLSARGEGIAPQAQADTREAQLLAFAVSEIRRDEMSDSVLLDAMEQKRIAVVPEYEGPWDAEVYNDEGKPNHRGSGSTPREAIRAAIAAAKGE